VVPPLYGGAVRLAVIALLLGSSSVAVAREAVLVYAPRPSETAPQAVREAAVKALRAAGREVLDGAIEKAIAARATVPDGGAPDGGVGSAADRETLLALRRSPSANGIALLASANSLDGVVLLAAGRDAGEVVVVGQRYDAAKQSLTRVEAVRVIGKTTLDEAVAALLARQRDAPVESHATLMNHAWIARPEAQPEPPGPPPTKKRTPFYLSVWFWGGLLVLAGGSIALTTYLVKPGEATATLEVDPRPFSGR
jgi:hypothetical protein